MVDVTGWDSPDGYLSVFDNDISGAVDLVVHDLARFAFDDPVGNDPRVHDDHLPVSISST